MFGMQSMTKTLARISASASKTDASSLPLPEKPSETTGCCISRRIIFTHAIPGREAQPPWAMLVP